jgi:hypothetical protein
MRTQIISTIAIATLVLSACGGGASGVQGEAADALVESAEAEGLDLDKSCVEDVAKKLSDSDAEKLAADADAELSPEGETMQFELFDCVDIDSYVDLLVADMGDEVDADCLKDALEDMDLSKGEDALFGALSECTDIGG